MSNYTLNGKSMTAEYGFTAGHADGGNLALKGAWDMPSRLHKTYHDWGTQQGIEPYVLPNEIRFGGRSIELRGYIKGTDKKDCLAKSYKLYSDIGTFTGLVPLASDKFGSWSVLVNGAVDHNYITQGIAEVMIPFREPVVDLTGIIPVNTEATDYGIDGISFERLGLTIIKMTGYGNRGAPKQGAFTAYQTEGYRVTKPGAREITINALMVQPNYAAFMASVRTLYALFAKPGLRHILKPNDYLREFFVTDGFTISQVRKNGEQIIAFLDLKIIEIGAYVTYEYLTDMSGYTIADMLDNRIITAK